MNKRALGTSKERLAGALLQLHGYCILEYNYRCKKGEIDIVAKHGEYLVFVEVKYREDDKKGLPQEAVNERKQKKICEVARHYCYEKSVGQMIPIRFDVIALMGQRYRIFDNAFEYKV